MVAGRRSGYVQMTLTLAGFILTVVFGVRAMVWSVVNWSRLHQPGADPLEALAETWTVMRWAVVGLAVFGVAWLWALGTSLGILNDAKRAETGRVPPPLG